MSIKDKYYMTISHKVINDNIFIKPFVYHPEGRGDFEKWVRSLNRRKKERKARVVDYVWDNEAEEAIYQ